MPLDAKIMCALVIGSVFGIQFQFIHGSSTSDLLKNIILGQAFTLWIYAIYRIAILPCYDYLVKRPMRKDIEELMSIARDFLPQDTYEKYSMEEREKSIYDLYNYCFAILLLIWINHLKETKKDSDTFLEISRSHYSDASSVYEHLCEDMDFDMMKVDMFELFHMCPSSKGEDYCRRLSYAAIWCARHLTTSEENVKSLSNLFVNLATDFIKANKL